MSCNCLNKTKEGQQFVCTCDEFMHPLRLNIGPGLPELPRQVAGFPEFRRAMLRAVPSKNGLTGWRAREKDDLGVMLLEMWAYICDSLAFYDKVIADESYLGTSKRRPSLRKLIALLGYLPAPATASFVKLVATSEGRLPVTVPAGTAFRSGSPAQVFEATDTTIIHPLNSKWTISAIRPDTILIDNPSWLLVEPRSEIKPFSKLLLLDYKDETQNQVLLVTDVETYTGADERKYTKLKFKSPAKLAKGTPLSRLWLLLPDHKSILIDLAAVMEVRDTPGLEHLLTRAASEGLGEYDWNHFRQKVMAKGDMEVLMAERKKQQVDAIELAMRYGIPTAGTIVNEFRQTLSSADKLIFEKRSESPPIEHLPEKFAMIDKNKRGVIVGGRIKYDQSRLKLNIGENWNPDLLIPVDVYGNLLEATRGETVRNEILGSGNANVTSQQFKLTKKPLTYLLAPSAMNSRGVQNTLRVYVNGIRWKEVATFYGVRPEEEVYIVRQDDQGDSYVIFGDGFRGKLLPTGNSNITAYYRHGAGKASPPASSITQIQSTVPGLAGVKNPLAAAGGSDAESADNLRSNAPRSALILGRAVSILDMEAVSLATPGVRTVQAEWHWHGIQQCPVVYIWYIGEAGIEILLTRRLRALTDPSTPIAVEQAAGVPVSIAIEVEVDERYVAETVLKNVRLVLSLPGTGLLSPEKLGVGKPLFRSTIFKAIVEVEGVVSVTKISWNGETFSSYAMKAPAGSYFDFENGEILLNGSK